MTMDKMSMEGFSKCIKMDLERMSDYEVELTRVVKVGDVPQYGIILRQEGEAISPILYLDRCYHAYLYDVLTLEQIEETLLKEVRNIPKPNFKGMIGNIFNFECVKDRIIYRLVSLEGDKEYLQGTPYISYYDMAIVFYLLVDMDMNGIASSKISQDELDVWGISTEQLYEIAKVNTRRWFPSKVESLEKCIIDLLGESIGELPSFNSAYVITNQMGMNGATTILYEDILEEVAKKMNSDFFLIPSSIHEMILYKKDLFDVDEQIQFLKGLVREQNKTMDKKDVLTDSVYLYDREIHNIRMM